MSKNKKANQYYHYTECGLDNIYLANGYEITKHNKDEEIYIHDIHGLHSEIGNLLVFKLGLLAGNEVKFIRSMLDLSQKSLGELLGLDYQTILGWEKNKTPISKTADRLLKIIFYSYLNKDKNSGVYDKVNELSELDVNKIDLNDRKIVLKETKDEWELVA
jgi:DNA-binding transcriptional regulator YiaG